MSALGIPTTLVVIPDWLASVVHSSIAAGLEKLFQP